MEIDADLHALISVLARQAFALDRLFMRAAADILLGKDRSLRDASRAVKAQHQSRTAFRLLIALQAARQKAEKSRNRTNELLERENPHHDQTLGQAPSETRLCRRQAPTQGLASGAPCPAGRDHPHLEALEKVERSADAGGQGPLGLERAEARLPKPPVRRAGPAGASAHTRRRSDDRARQAPPSLAAGRTILALCYAPKSLFLPRPCPPICPPKPNGRRRKPWRRRIRGRCRARFRARRRGEPVALVCADARRHKTPPWSP